MKYLVILIGSFLSVRSEYSATGISATRSLNRKDKRLLPFIDEPATSTTLDLFELDELARRNQIDTIWNWDWWCQLQPKFGTGNAQIVRYYYDALLDQCLTFTFKGSDGNENNFNSLIECERHCKGTAYMTLKDSSRTLYCGLQPNCGMCLALNYRYHYDVNSKDCKSFVYGGCGGNQNRFITYEECKKRCIGADDV